MILYISRKAIEAERYRVSEEAFSQQRYRFLIYGYNDTVEIKAEEKRPGKRDVLVLLPGDDYIIESNNMDKIRVNGLPQPR